MGLSHEHVLPVKSREVHVSCYLDNNYVMRYCHQSVGVISHLVFLTYGVSLIPVIKCTNMQGLTLYYVDLNSRISHSVSKVDSQQLIRSLEAAITKPTPVGEFYPGKRSYSNQSFGVVTI